MSTRAIQYFKTDITGFGLLGHIAEMVSDSPFGIRLISDTIPIMPEACDYARMGLVSAGAYKNREFCECKVDFAVSVDLLVQNILFDPQASGGLLICVERNSAKDLLAEL